MAQFEKTLCLNVFSITLLLGFAVDALANVPNLVPAKWSFSDACETVMASTPTPLQAWRREAIEKIRAGLNPKRKDAQLAILDFSAFIPPNLEEVSRALPQGMVALYQQSDGIEAGQYFEFNQGPRAEHMPKEVMAWAKNANDFVSELVMEAILPFYRYGMYVKQSDGQAKIAIGGQSHTFSDYVVHDDGNSLVTIVINAAGDATTDYYLYRYKPGDSAKIYDRYEDRLGPAIRAPKHSIIIMPGREWAYADLGAALYHKAPNVEGPRFAIIQFIGRR